MAFSQWQKQAMCNSQYVSISLSALHCVYFCGSCSMLLRIQLYSIYSSLFNFSIIFHFSNFQQAQLQTAKVQKLTPSIPIRTQRSTMRVLLLSLNRSMMMARLLLWAKGLETATRWVKIFRSQISQMSLTRSRLLWRRRRCPAMGQRSLTLFLLPWPQTNRGRQLPSQHRRCVTELSRRTHEMTTY